MRLDQRFAEAMGSLLGPDFPSDIALAVSGGGDSMAMLYLAHNWTRVWGVRLHVVTVDHGLRAESAQEAALVARDCAELGWSHDVLRWHWDGHGNKMDAARRGRLDLIDAWRGPIRHVLMAHTLDDVAETLLIRMKRGSGVEGLSAMQATRRIGAGEEGFCVMRPCLSMRRAELRHYLTVLQGAWVEDPSNSDPHYDRSRMRALLPALEEAGVTVARLAETAEAMARAGEALAARAASVWDQIGREGAVDGHRTGDLLFHRDGFADVEQDTRLRLLAAALRFVSGAAYRPRLDALETLLDRVLAGGSGTLHGCEVVAGREEIHVFREVAALVPEHDGLWDGRWRLAGGAEGVISALGDAGWQAASAQMRAPFSYRVARALPVLENAAKRQSFLETPDAFRYCPMGRPGLTFARFLTSH